jgi:hypothetical protein
MAQNVVYGTYAEPIYAKTPENPLRCHVPLRCEEYVLVLHVERKHIFVYIKWYICKSFTYSYFAHYICMRN